MSETVATGSEKIIANGVSVTELARRVNLDKSTVSRYFSGERVPTFWVALQMADALMVDPWQLARLIPAPVVTGK